MTIRSIHPIEVWLKKQTPFRPEYPKKNGMNQPIGNYRPGPPQALNASKTKEGWPA